MRTNELEPVSPNLACTGALRPWAVFWGAWLVATLLWDALGADLQVMHWLGNAQGFAWRDHWFMSAVMHTGARQLALLLYLGVLLMVWWPVGVFRSLTRPQRLQAWVGVTLAVLAVNLMKRSSLTSCPWDLKAFGGAASYVSHWAWGLRDGGSGFCFPGGHASSAFAFLALALVWLASPHAPTRQRGLRWSAVCVALGLLLGAVQTVRGAHYLSHTAWTAVVCAVVVWGNQACWTWLQRHLNVPSKGSGTGRPGQNKIQQQVRLVCRHDGA